MEFINTYGKEIVSLVIPFITWFLNVGIKAKAMLIWANPHAFTFLVPEPIRDAEGNVLKPSQIVHTAGMCGGFAFVLDLDGDFAEHVNTERVDLEPLTAEDEATIQRMVRRHFEYTRSERAEEVLRKWNTLGPRFVKVFPRDLKLALDARLNSHTGDG